MPRRTARSDRFQLISPSASDGSIRVVRHIKLWEGEDLLRTGKGVPVMHQDGVTVIGFQLRPELMQRVPGTNVFVTRDVRTVRVAGTDHFVSRDGMAQPSNAAFSQNEIATIAGQAFRKGKSRTEGLSDEKRAERIRMGWRAEDQVERARAKLKHYQATH